MNIIPRSFCAWGTSLAIVDSASISSRGSSEVGHLPELLSSRFLHPESCACGISDAKDARLVYH